MKYINIDTKSRTNDNKIYISNFTVNYFEFKDGMEIYAYTNECVWNAVIHKFISDEKCELWYVELCSLRETLEINDEQVKWNSISLENGICLGKSLKTGEIIRRMKQLGYTMRQINEIVK